MSTNNNAAILIEELPENMKNWETYKNYLNMHYHTRCSFKEPSQLLKLCSSLSLIEEMNSDSVMVKMSLLTRGFGFYRLQGSDVENKFVFTLTCFLIAAYKNRHPRFNHGCIVSAFSEGSINLPDYLRTAKLLVRKIIRDREYIDISLEELYTSIFRQRKLFIETLLEIDTIEPQMAFMDFFSATGIKKMISNTLLSSIQKMIDDAMSSFNEAAQEGLNIGMTIACITWSFKVFIDEDSSLLQLVGAVIALILQLLFNPLIRDCISTVFSSICNVMPQMDFSFGTMDISPLIAGLSILPFFTALKSDKDAASSITKLIKDLASIGQAKKGLTEILVSVFETIKSFGKGIARQLGIPVGIDSSGSSLLDSFFEEFEELLAKERQDGLILSLENLFHIKDLIAKGNKIMHSSMHNPIHKHYTNIVMSRMKELTNLETQFTKASVTETGLRFETIGMMFFGPPGVHKSFVLKRISDDAVAMDSTPEEMKQNLLQDRTFIFNRQSENKYWDGFSPKTKVIMIDDYGQSTEESTADGESMQSIRMLNSFPHDLHTAAMSGKGVLRNNAKFAFASTNLTKLAPEDIVSPQALQRRWKCYFVSLKDEYLKKGSNRPGRIRDQKKDESKFVGKDGLAVELTTDMFVFYSYDAAKGSIDLSASYSYDQLINELKKTYKIRYSHYEMNQKVYKKCNLAFYNKLDNEGFHDEINQIKLRMRQNAEQFDMDFDKVFNKKEEEEPIEMVEPQMGIFNSLTNRNLSSYFDRETSTYDEIPSSWYGDLGSFDEVLKMNIKLCSLSYMYDKMANLAISDEKYNHSVEILNGMLDETPYQVVKTIQTYCQLNHLELHRALLSHLRITDPTTWNMVLEGVVPPYGFLPPRLALSYERDAFENLSDMYAGVRKNISKGWRTCIDVGFLCGKVISEFVKKHPIIIFITLIGSLGGIAYACKKLIKSEIHAEPQHIYNPAEKNNKTTKFATKLADLKIKPQLDEVSLAMAKKIDVSNLVTLGIYENDAYKRLGSLLMIKGRIGICNLHYVSYFSEYVSQHPTTDRRIFLRHKNVDIFDIPFQGFVNLFRDEDQCYWDNDVAFFNMPRSFRPFRDISEFFVNEKTILSKYRINMLTNLPSQEVYVCTSTTVNTTSYLRLPVTDDVVLKVSRSLHYNLPSKKGDCGTPLYFVDPLVGNKKILGFHCAAGTGQAYGTIITYEDIKNKLAYMEKKYGNQIVPTEEHIKEDCEVTPQLLDDFLVESITDLSHRVQNVHDKIPSSFRNQEGWPKTQELSALNCVNGISPLSLALKHFSKGNFSIDSQPLYVRSAFELAHNDLGFMIMGIPRYQDMSVPTLEQALWGDGELDMINAIKSQSSAGCLLKKEFHILKDRLFSHARDSTNPYFRYIKERYDKNMERYNRGERIPDVYTFNLKSETLPIEKVLACKTRGYFGAGLDTMILFNMYFGKFSTSFIKSMFTNETCLGINEKSINWQILADKLRIFSDENDPIVGDSDYSKFDTCHFKDLLWVMLDYINQWYDNKDDANSIRTWLWHELVFPRVIIGNHIFTLQRGMVSGNALTIIINCMVNCFLFRYCVFRIKDEHNLQFSTFKEVVSLCVVGDDNIYSVRKDMRQYINPLSLAGFVSELGFIMTSADKESTISSQHKKLSSCLFLKRGFDLNRFNPAGIIFAPLSKDVIYNTPQWTQKKDYDKGIFVANINSSIRESALHGKEFYESFQKLVIESIARTDNDLIGNLEIMPWHDIIDIIYK